MELVNPNGDSMNDKYALTARDKFFNFDKDRLVWYGSDTPSEIAKEYITLDDFFKLL